MDRYEIVREIGRGGMAVVHEVRHRQLGSRHALKVLLPGPPELARRLLQEGRVQAGLRHPNIVAVTDVVAVGDRPGLILELVDGIPLDDWLTRHPDCDDATRRRLATQIATAVAYAHAQGAIHRDLKPANVLVIGDAAPWAKVADFGLARWLSAPELTRTGVPLGTPRYMAPEQIADGKHVDARADVFSLGCLLADLWGAPAFAEKPLPDLFEDIVEGRFEVPPGAPEDVAAAIRAALEPNLDRRTPSAVALLQMLHSDEAPVIREIPVAPPTRRRPGVLGIALGLASGLVGATAAAVALAVGVWVAIGPAPTPVVAPAPPQAVVEVPPPRHPIRRPPPRRAEPVRGRPTGGVRGPRQAPG
jgi:serine/threonine-protein kinase